MRHFKVKTGEYEKDKIYLSGHIICLVIVLEYLYHLSFNVVPLDIRYKIAGGIAILIGLNFLYCVFLRPRSWHILILISLLSTLISWSVAYSILPGTFLIRSVILDTQVFLLLIILLTFHDALPQRVIAIFASIVLIYGGVLSVFGESFYYTLNDWRPQSMTGGPTRIHPTAYFITANLLIVDLFRRAGAISPKIAWPILLIGLLSIILYQVRTCWFMLAVYVVGMLFLRARGYIPMRISVPFAISVFIIGVALIFGFLNVESLVGVSSEHWGSGRVGAYGERLELIVNRPGGTLFFGTGPGTDLLHTRVWGGVKASHSDFLQILVEQGLIGFVGMLLLIYTVIRVVTPYGRIVFFTIIAGSIINNGILSGFGIGIYFYIALALAVTLSPAIQRREAERKMDPGRAREWARVGR